MVDASAMAAFAFCSERWWQVKSEEDIESFVGSLIRAGVNLPKVS